MTPTTPSSRQRQATYKVAFDTADHATVYSSTGQKIYEIDRF
ncbi:hypothetical protein SAMN05216483_3778 [Streptomyces sp. 2131.1]|nr:hypothetical protein [Streptomyces sp. 2131.1]SED40852.1 hypothetical protein SAMN05216483_3778 [Streptomyces sp. 2131.1]